jgi:UDP-GlcNAc:undecaprenyl-phosphate GlcNAc-1-phosphate transferase
MLLFVFYIAIILISFLIILQANRVGNFLCLIDYPSKSKIHNNPTPMIGGSIIALNLICTFFFSKYLSGDPINFFFLLYIFSFFLIGLVDDIFNLKSIYRVLLVLIISCYFIFVQENFAIEKLYFSITNNHFYFGSFKFLVTILCILLLYIAFNMADGINCLLITFCLFSIFFYKFIIFGNISLDLLSFIIFLSLLIILYYNYYNKIFLGNSGASLLAGYFIYLLISQNFISNIDVFQVISIPIIMGIDMIRIFFERIANKKNIFKRDNNHFHHILLRNFKLKNSILIYLLLSFFPIAFSKLFKIEVLFLIPFPIVIYFLLIKNLK